MFSVFLFVLYSCFVFSGMLTYTERHSDLNSGRLYSSFFLPWMGSEKLLISLVAFVVSNFAAI